MKEAKPRILYAFQGTGNGHVSRAREIIPILKEFAEVDILISGSESQVELQYSIKYKFRGLVFYYTKRGAVSYFKTLFKINLFRFVKELIQVPVAHYDLIINDFESVSAWSCKFRHKPIIGLSHQAAFLSKNSPRPKAKNILGELILRYYAPIEKNIAFHYKAYDTFIYPPIIRLEIRNAKTLNLGHYTVYLPAYADAKVVEVLQNMKGVSWHLFSRKANESKQYGNVLVRKIGAEKFAESLTSAAGLLCSAGFEGPSEALYLGKKLFVIPIKGQYEQYCNAIALQEMGLPSAMELDKNTIPLLQDWLRKPQNIKLCFPNQTREILAREIFDEY